MKPTSRLASIDCFRSFAVLTMVLASYLFGTEAIPTWLRHAPDGRLISPALATAIPVSGSRSRFGGAS
jgi:predicted acyltransferase